MNGPRSSAELERFRSAIALRIGMWFDEQKFQQLSEVLERRLIANGEHTSSYLSKLEIQADLQRELREIARELTVGETYFFRHVEQFRAFAEVALPSRLEARGASRQLRLLSAGCSSGEEAYTLSILTRTLEPTWDVVIHAVDINETALERARKARYSPWALRETPDGVQKQFFTPDGRDFALSKAVRESVCFEEGNLVADDSWAPESFDVIFCRNVLMYFSPENIKRVVARFARALAPGGFLFLGHAENLRDVSVDFDLCHTHGTFYYRRKGALAKPLSQLKGIKTLATAPRPALALDWTSTWLETVQRSSDRIRTLAERPAPGQPPAVAAKHKHVNAGSDLSAALDLLAQERFAEALDVVTGMSPNASNDADVLLLRAALLTHCDRLDAAETACEKLLVLDGLSAGAHYLRSLCRERREDTPAAIEYAQIACYLDPAFAMPHLHLGLIARRMGERDTALRELTQASLLLRREAPSRLLLFGGGFSREGLTAFCQSELSRLAGSP